MTERMYCPNAIFSGNDTKCVGNGSITTGDNKGCCWHDDEGKNIPINCGIIDDNKERKTCIIFHRTIVSAIQNEISLPLDDSKKIADKIMTVFNSMMNVTDLRTFQPTNETVTPSLTKTNLEDLIKKTPSNTLNAGIQSLKEQYPGIDLSEITRESITTAIDTWDDNGVQMRLIRYMIKKTQGQSGGGILGKMGSAIGTGLLGLVTLACIFFCVAACVSSVGVMGCSAASEASQAFAHMAGITREKNNKKSEGGTKHLKTKRKKRKYRKIKTKSKKHSKKSTKHRKKSKKHHKKSKRHSKK